MRNLLGEEDGPICHPILPTVHGANRVLGIPAHDSNYGVVVGLGCVRQCEFCSTSHQYGGRYIPIIRSAREMFRFMKDVERHERSHNGRRSSIGFVLYDENFLLNRKLVEEFRRLNREQLLDGTQFLCFVFADAKVLSTYSVEALLEMGVDSVWVGIESLSADGLRKLHHVDIRKVITDLSEHGIKVFASIMAGFEHHDEGRIREDMEFALTVPATSFQYSPVSPLPGTAYYKRLEAAGMLFERDLTYFSMSHYNVRHPLLTEEKVLGLINEFLDRDYARNGPLIYRFLKVRWDGYRRTKDSRNPYVRARSRIFRRDVLRGFPVMLVGQVFSPTGAVRDKFAALEREVRAAFRRREILMEIRRGKLDLRDGGLYLFSSLPALRGLVRWLLVLIALFWDPRTRPSLSGFWHFLWNLRESIRIASRGVMPWGQPNSVSARYPPGRCHEDPAHKRL
jgi:radical SAM superfamily enzyme YgiQ (UPF0313 family)